jgi:electron-transferring-flavoprotein dehydrogenase
MRELFPDLDPSEWPFAYQEVTKDAVYLLTKRAALPLVPMPPNFRNHGNYVVSIAKLSRFLAEKAEERGAYVLTETVADKLLVEDRIVRGIRSGDRGRGKDGEPLGNFEPGSDVVARTTVLAEGTLGHLSQAALDYFDLHGSLPVRWELGVKEVWKVSKPLDRVIHTMGWPLRKRPKWNEFGGSFIYPMGEDKLCVGLVVGLDYTDSTLSVHDLLQELKTHPFVRKMLDGGERIAWGAKTIPSGGYFSMPRSLTVPGMALAGDAANMVNVPTLKGIHYALYAGMFAADAIFEALKRDSVNLDSYDARVRNSVIGNDLFESRNMRQPFSKGFFIGGAVASAMTITKGLFPGGKWKYEPDIEILMSDGGASERYPEPDNKLTFNKLDSVFLSGNATRDDAPNHVRVQSHVPRELAKTWVNLCPAQVYEIPDDQLSSGAPEVDVHVTASNCVQCGAINAKGGRLTMPEGGDGPLYQEL